MSGKTERQFCAVCAWRENCAKKFCVPDGGAHCPDFTRDISIKSVDEEGEAGEEGKQDDREEQ